MITDILCGKIRAFDIVNVVDMKILIVINNKKNV
jgi:hypothetical protein